MRQSRRQPVVSRIDREEGMSIARAEAELTILKGEFERARVRYVELQQRITKIQNYIDVAREFESTGSRFASRKPAGKTIAHSTRGNWSTSDTFGR